MLTLTTILTVAVAIATIVAGFSTFFQWRLNRYRIKIELHDKIKHIYDNTHKLADHIFSYNNLSFNKATEYRIATSSAKFILKGKAKKHIEEIQSKSMKLAFTCMRIEGLRNANHDDEYTSLLQEKESLIEWHLQQPPITDNVFKKYLDISR
jgi:hypothetical protein